MSQHLEHFSEHDLTTADKDSSDTSTKSSEFESIYDKYRDKSDEEVEDSFTDKNDPVPFQPAEVSNDELNEMLDDLEEGASAGLAEAPNELGARPKELPTTHTNNEVPDIVMDHDQSVPRDSPPPYSEIDPMKQPTLERPSSLEISSNSCQEDEESNVTEEISEGKQIPFFITIYL